MMKTLIWRNFKKNGNADPEMMQLWGEHDKDYMVTPSGLMTNH